MVYINTHAANVEGTVSAHTESVGLYAQNATERASVPMAGKTINKCKICKNPDFVYKAKAVSWTPEEDDILRAGRAQGLKQR
jgi:hypothetical protein